MPRFQEDRTWSFGWDMPSAPGNHMKIKVVVFCANSVSALRLGYPDDYQLHVDLCLFLTFYLLKVLYPVNIVGKRISNSSKGCQMLHVIRSDEGRQSYWKSRLPLFQRALPPVFNVPFIGPVPYLPNGLKSNLRRVLFFGWGCAASFYFLLLWARKCCRSTSPWAGPYLKEEYKDLDNLEVLTRQMEKDVSAPTVCFEGLFVRQRTTAYTWFFRWPCMDFWIWSSFR